jgi:hypothetical protein
LLDPVDDLPPATIVTSARADGGKLIVRGVSHDNGPIVAITVNGQPATVTSSASGVVDWQITLDAASAKEITAAARDQAGNAEQTPHVYRVAAPAHHNH